METDPFVVLSQLESQTVYKVQEVGSDGDENVKVLHRNMLYSLLTFERNVTDNRNMLAKANIVILGSLFFLKTLLFKTWEQVCVLGGVTHMQGMTENMKVTKLCIKI